MTTRIGPELAALIAAAWPAVCAEVAEGAHVGDTYKKHRFTRGQAAAFLASDIDARRRWEEAREQSADTFFDRMLALANSPKADPKSTRAEFEILKWIAGKRNPRYYGERAHLDLNVRTVDLTRIISDAQARLAAQRAGRLIDGEVVRAALPATLADIL